MTITWFQLSDNSPTALSATGLDSLAHQLVTAMGYHD